jgi:hypothetical protein
MRQLARKNAQSVVIPPDIEAEQEEVQPASLKRFFHGWLREVAPRETGSREDQDVGIRRITRDLSRAIARPAPLNLQRAYALNNKRAILTVREMLGVNRATVRESAEHRAWPTDVVLTFMAADVVTRRLE